MIGSQLLPALLDSKKDTTFDETALGALGGGFWLF